MEGKFTAIMPGRWINQTDYSVTVKYEGEYPYNGKSFEGKLSPHQKLRKREKLEEVDWYFREVAIMATVALEDLPKEEGDNVKELFDKAVSIYESDKKRYKPKIKKFKKELRKERRRSKSSLLSILRV